VAPNYVVARWEGLAKNHHLILKIDLMPSRQALRWILS
jgi:hypothetical protein